MFGKSILGETPQTKQGSVRVPVKNFKVSDIHMLHVMRKTIIVGQHCDAALDITSEGWHCATQFVLQYVLILGSG